ncbi:hypothetical protein CWI84_09155 [Idiomarina tyrosinivorans]|uniref:ABC transporter n=1 Tax=Idiomarina tyrosinivorans TaxID=1445662 RepID=A0A432ZPM6_9GAMM|nr:VacJ family lipoprotein [Idiomarina tyrosinivorans]RUO79786.1 hypothetical protein CWI84_09155 [Idiomarina tyrosinivorans]
MKKFLIILGVVMLSACSSTPDDQYVDQRDPFEDVNRDMWEFNRDLDEAVIKPAADVYDEIPEPVRRSLYTMMDNLDEPSSMVNNLLQGKVADAGISLGRFLLNSTVGLLGLFDVATPLGLDKRQEGFGEVLASWGVGNGPYLMLPVIGPTVPTDRGGDVADGQYFPFPLLSWPIDLARYTIKGLDARIELRKQERVLNNALDPYTFVKEAYFQNWRNRVYDGQVPDDEMGDDFSGADDEPDESVDN